MVHLTFQTLMMRMGIRTEVKAIKAALLTVMVAGARRGKPEDLGSTASLRSRAINSHTIT
jgi:hypothetical protein